MLQTKNKNSLKGMTLVEVVIGMTVIILVTVIAYMGVSTSANFIQKGTDLRNLDGTAVEEIEAARQTYYERGAEETTVINYSVNIVEKVTDAGGAVEGTAPVTNYSGSVNVGVVTADAGQIEYDMYLPYVVTAVPEADTP